MSNTQVGNVYSQIINDVVESSRVDFEEGGVDENVLEILKQGWQQKLSTLQVATFPWDPKPEPVQPNVTNPPTVPSNAGNYSSMGTPPVTQSQSGLTMPQMSANMTNGPRIKTEPGMDTPPYAQPPPVNLPGNASVAQQRAAQHLQQNYGARASASISAIQSGMPGQQQQLQNGQNGQQQQQQQQAPQQLQHIQMIQRQRAQLSQAHGIQPQNGQGQGMQQQAPRQMTHDQYQRYMAEHAARQGQLNAGQNGNSNGLHNAQTDGVGDEVESFGVLRGIGPNGEDLGRMGRVEIDGLLRSKIMSMGQTMEGGGLMLPLQKASTTEKRTRRVKRTNTSQVDGGDDDDDDKSGVKDEDFDEDAINSDLDDPDEGANEEEDDDEGMGHIMLCMYDKVQRVKNKWKCVMKDGVLTVNGKEYVFHKATGEYEW